MHRDYPVATILLVAILIAGIFLVSDYVADQSERETERYSVLHTDGSPVPDTELDWLQQAANTLAYEADDTFLQQTIQSDGLSGAFMQWTAGSFGPGAVFGGASASPEAYPLTTPEASYYLDKNGNIVLHAPTDAQVFMPFYEGLAAVGVFPVDASSETLEPEFRYIDREGKTVIPDPFTNALPFSDGIAVVSTRSPEGDVRYGTIDRSGAWQITPKFDVLFEFVDGLAAAQLNNPDHSARVAGFVAPSGAFVVTLENVQRMQSSHHDGLALVWRTESPEYSFVDREGNTVLTPDYEQVEPFSNGRAAFLVEDRWGYMDTKGNEIIPPLNQLPIPFLDAKVAVVHMAAIDDSSYHFTLTMDEAGNVISTDRE